MTDEGTTARDSGDGTERTRAPRRAGRILGASIAGAAVLGGALLIGQGLWQTWTPTPAPAAAERQVVDSAADTAQPLTAAPPTALRIPVIGFETDVLPLDLGGETVIRPPSLTEAFWLEEFAAAGADSAGTVYLAGHSSAAGTSVFDPLVDRQRGGATVQVGDEILVDTENGTVVYDVQATAQYPKTELSEIRDLWTSSPGRLVLITCYYQDGATSAPDNFVVYARISAESAGQVAAAG